MAASQLLTTVRRHRRLLRAQYSAYAPLPCPYRCPAGYGSYQYFIKIIPTIYTDANEEETLSNQVRDDAVCLLTHGQAPHVSGRRRLYVSHHVLVCTQFSVTTQYQPGVVHGRRQNVLPGAPVLPGRHERAGAWHVAVLTTRACGLFVPCDAGIFFVYDLSPFMVRVTEHTVPFTHFLTGLCAIAGGVFTVRPGAAHGSSRSFSCALPAAHVLATVPQVAGIIDSCIYHSSKRLRHATGRL